MNGGTGKFLLSLNIHLLVNRRLVNSPVLPEKIRALKEIVQSGCKNSVAINLENLRPFRIHLCVKHGKKTVITAFTERFHFKCFVALP